MSAGSVRMKLVVPLARRLLASMGRGQALVEYSLILCLVVTVVIVLIILMGNQVQNLYCNITGSFHN